MRILKFIGAFLGTLLVVFFIVFGFNLDALTTLFKNSEDLQEGQEWVSRAGSLKGLTQYIGQNPEHTAIVSRSVTNPDTTIAYGENEPHTLGTLSNFFLITTYVRLVEDDEINPDELINLEEIDRYQLPYIDASNHGDAKNALEITDNKVRLHDLVQATIIYNDLAASDFLFQKLGADQIAESYQLLDLQHTDAPLPFAGLYITLHPDLNGSDFATHYEKLNKLSKKAFREQVQTNFDRYLKDEEFHTTVNTLFDETRGLGIGFTERRDILSLFPKSTAAELSQLMVQLEQDNLISESVSKGVKDLMNWPFDEKGLNNDFEYYGAIYDSRLGLLNGLDYGASVYSKEPFGQAVFFDSLQVAFWFHMSSNMMHQDYQQRLMWDPALRTATLQEIGK